MRMNLSDWLETIAGFLLIVLFLAVLWTCNPAHSQVTNASPQQVEISSQVVYGLSYGQSTQIQNYVEPTTTTALFPLLSTVFVPPSTNDQPVDLATMFPFINTPMLWSLQDISNPAGDGFHVGLAAGGARLNIAPSAYFTARVSSGSPVFYVDNPSATSYVILKVCGLAN